MKRHLLLSLSNYGSDFTDTDGDGMTDVAELRYGFDPNDKNSFPTKDYTILSENNEPELHNQLVFLILRMNSVLNLQKVIML